MTSETERNAVAAAVAMWRGFIGELEDPDRARATYAEEIGVLFAPLTLVADTTEELDRKVSIYLTALLRGFERVVIGLGAEIVIREPRADVEAILRSIAAQAAAE